MTERPPGTHGTGAAPPAGAYAHAHEAPYEPPHESVEFDREIQYHQLIWMGVALLVIAVVSAVLVFFLLRGFVSWRAASAAAPPLVAPGPAPAAPQLLPHPESELARVRGEETQRLATYGWVDQTAGVAHIPVERAIDIVAARGLPTRAAAPTPAPAATATVPAMTGAPSAAPAAAAPASAAAATTPEAPR